MGRGAPLPFTHPKRRTSNLSDLASCRAELARVYNATRTGEISADMGRVLTYILRAYADLEEASRIEERLEAVEAMIEAAKNGQAQDRGFRALASPA